MQNITTIFGKEIASFFNSLVGYVVICVFLVLTGLFFWVLGEHVMVTGQANMDLLFFYSPWFFIFLIPAITMRSFSEEIRSGTIEFLTTKPVTDWQIILGKFSAAAFLVLIAILPTMFYWVTLDWLALDPTQFQTGGNPDLLIDDTSLLVNSPLDNGPIIGAYIGLFALGVIFAAIGILSSTLSNNQVVAFVIGAVLCFFMFFGWDLLSEIEALNSVNVTVSRVGVFAHYDSISRGVVDTRDIVYFASVVSVALLAARLTLALKKR